MLDKHQREPRVSASAELRKLELGRPWCAWQESNLLPLAPQASALSGELQAREPFSLGEHRRRPWRPSRRPRRGCSPPRGGRKPIYATPTTEWVRGRRSTSSGRGLWRSLG